MLLNSLTPDGIMNMTNNKTEILSLKSYSSLPLQGRQSSECFCEYHESVTFTGNGANVLKRRNVAFLKFLKP